MLFFGFVCTIFSGYVFILGNANAYPHSASQCSQEAIWSLSDNGQEYAAKTMESELMNAMLFSEVVSRDDNCLKFGRHKSALLVLANNIQCIFKPYSPLDISMDYKAEVAAYQLDKLVKLNRVPMTVVREIDGCKGSLQYYIKNATPAIDSDGSVRPLTQDIKFFDYLIRNWDRSAENYIYKNGREIAIDHGWAFRTKDFYHWRPKRWSLKEGNEKQFSPLPSMHRRVALLSDKDVRLTLASILKKGQIDAVIARKNAFFNVKRLNNPQQKKTSKGGVVAFLARLLLKLTGS